MINIVKIYVHFERMYILKLLDILLIRLFSFILPVFFLFSLVMMEPLQYEVHLYLVDSGLVKWWCNHKVESYPDNEVDMLVK